MPPTDMHLYADPVDQHTTAEPKQSTEAASAPPQSLEPSNVATTSTRASKSARQHLVNKCQRPDEPCWPAESASALVARSFAYIKRQRCDTVPRSNPQASRKKEAPKQAPAPPARSHGNDSCSTISVEDDSDEAPVESLEFAVKLPVCCSEQSVQHASETAARADSMHVSCGSQEQFPLVAAVRYIFRAAVGRYCGHVRASSIQQVCTRALVVIEEMLKGLYRYCRYSIPRTMPQRDVLVQRCIHHACVFV